MEKGVKQTVVLWAKEKSILAETHSERISSRTNKEQYWVALDTDATLCLYGESFIVSVKRLVIEMELVLQTALNKRFKAKFSKGGKGWFCLVVKKDIDRRHPRAFCL